MRGADLGDNADTVDLAGLIAPLYEAEIGSEIP
jgi:hypothetical protein